MKRYPAGRSNGSKIEAKSYVHGDLPDYTERARTREMPNPTTVSDSEWKDIPSGEWTTLLEYKEKGFSVYLYLEATHEQTYFRVYVDGKKLYFAAADDTLCPYMLKHVYGYPGLNSPISYAKENPSPPAPLFPAYNIVCTIPLQWDKSLKITVWQGSGVSKKCGATVIINKAV